MRDRKFVADLLMPGLVHPLVAMTALLGAVFGSFVHAPGHRGTARAVRTATAPAKSSLTWVAPEPSSQGTEIAPMSEAQPGLLDGMVDGAPWQQVRIEQRLIIRITPGMGREFPPPPPPQPVVPPHGPSKPRRGGNCVSLGSIASIRPSGVDSQIMLLLRDRRQLVANLEKSCSARDFYVGFYAEQNDDGMLCAGRDEIHSRAGATCLITRLQEMGR